MALSKIDIENMVTGEVNVANGGTGLSSGTSGQFLKFTGSTTVASAAGGGITEFDTFFNTAVFAGDANPITGNWSRNAEASFEKEGTGVSESSGTFSFSQTGKFLILFHCSWTDNSGAGETTYLDAGITTCTNGTDFNNFAEVSASSTSSDSPKQTATCSGIIDVTNTTNVKCRVFSVVQNNNWKTRGASTQGETYVTFIRLGDT